MIKIKMIMAFFLLAGMAAQAQEVKFIGKADQNNDGDKIIIYNRNGLHDSAVIQNGKFVFDIPFKEPGLFAFYNKTEAQKKGGYAPYGILVAQPGSITLEGDFRNFQEVKVSGAEENELYQNFSAPMAKARNEIIDHLTEKYGKELVMSSKPDTSSTQYKALMKEYFELSNANEKKQVAALKDFINSHPKSFTAVFLLNGSAPTLELNDVESLYAALAPDYKNSAAGESIASIIKARKTTAIGQPAPDFTLADTLGNPVKLSDFRGKYVLVDFWASWCGPCRAENPNLVKTYHRFKDKNFTVLGVSLDQPGAKESWLKAIHKDNLTWTQVSDLKFWDNEAAILYGVKAIPANFLLDPGGKIIAKDLRGEDLNKKLEEVL